MKKLMFALLLLFGAVATGHGQDTLEILQYPKEQDQALRKIEIQELPEMARQALGSEDYSSWIVKAAYKTPVVDPENPQDLNKVNYLVELRKGKETKTVRFDNEGNRIKGDEN